MKTSLRRRVLSLSPLKAVADLGWSQPTLIQEKAIPLALEGKDVLARARTGSGKTAAYAVPVLQRILASKQVRRRTVPMKKGNFSHWGVGIWICSLSLTGLHSVASRLFSFSFSWPLSLCLGYAECSWAGRESPDPGTDQRTGSASSDHDQTVNGILLQGRPSGRHLWKSWPFNPEVWIQITSSYKAVITGIVTSSFSLFCWTRPILMEKPDIVVGTPSRILAHLKAQNLLLHSSLEMLVVDEADLLFSFGFEADLKNLLWWELHWRGAI